MKVAKSLLYSCMFVGFCISSTIAAKKITRSTPHHEESSGGSHRPHTTHSSASKDIAQWSFLTYIAADNNLAPYANYNINDMQAGLAATAGLNVLVQWDQPNNNKTWRYRITPSGRIEDASLSSEMGYNPARELVDSMAWVSTKYTAQRYALVLWNHGSGVEDFSPGVRSLMPSWFSIPETNITEELRGMLYDDSQKTCLTNQGLTDALTQVKAILGKNLDLLATDACLMAMVEVIYQMKGLVDIFVGSEQTIPGNGYPYSKFLRPLSQNPAEMDARTLATAMVASYQQYYTTQEPTPDFTLSAIDVKNIEFIKQNIDQFVLAVAACKKENAVATKQLIVSARRAATEFEMPEYIDLYSFYINVFSKIKKASPKSLLILNSTDKGSTPLSPAFKSAQESLKAVIQNGIQILSQTIICSASGRAMPQAKGLSIYYPSYGGIHSSYPKTIFAQNSQWANFIKEYR